MQTDEGSLQRRPPMAPFAVLVVATGLAVLADGLFAIAVAWVLAASDQPGLLAAMLAVSAVVRLGLMRVGGALADRYSKATLLRVSAVVRAGTATAVAWSLSADEPAIALAAMAVLGVASAIHYPADRAVVVELVQDSGLNRANGILQTVMNTGNVAGPALGGALLASLGGSETILVAAGTYIAGALTLLFLRVPKHAHATQSPAGLWRSTIDGIRHATSDRPLFVLLMVIAMMNLGFVGPFAIAVPAHVVSNLGGHPATLAFLQAGFAAGSIAGAILIATIWKEPRPAIIPTSVAIIAAGMAVLGLTTSPAVAVTALVIGGVASGVANVVLITAIQRRTDKNYIGRTMGLVTVMAMGLAPLSHALTGSALTAFSSTAVICAGTLITAIGVPPAATLVKKGLGN